MVSVVIQVRGLTTSIADCFEGTNFWSVKEENFSLSCCGRLIMMTKNCFAFVVSVLVTFHLTTYHATIGATPNYDDSSVSKKTTSINAMMWTRQWSFHHSSRLPVLRAEAVFRKHPWQCIDPRCSSTTTCSSSCCDH